MSFDEEVEKINQKKFDELMEQRMRDKAKGEGSAPGVPIPLSDETFSAEVANHPLMVVDFWAEWCGPCRMVGPIIEELASEYSGKVAFGKVNVDENPRTSQAFGVQSIPTILVFRNGRPVDGIVGAVPKAQIVGKFLRYVRDDTSSPYR
ncbi:MAG TPA: thioredoxin [Nitrososphaerales archaeon]|nr:thioredoxin [Nitrososphaerales archaeon]